jgi:alpha-tubulin suppressor-like RCC1 family protein
MTTLTSIIAPTNILTPSSTATVTNKTVSGANNTLTVRMANDVSGTLPTTNGGAGQTTYTDGQLLIGNTAGSLTKTTLTAGTNIAITNSGGSISIAYCEPLVYSIYSWGSASNGKLGDNTTVSKSSPVSVVGGFTDWSEVSGGGEHSLGVRQNGTAWSWGQVGKLGNNTTTGDVSSPVSVVGGFTDWCNISAGTNFSLAIRTNSTIWSWGAQAEGQLGDGTTTTRSSPVSVVGGFTDWCQVSAGNNHSAAVRTNGTIWGWGCNAGGRLGDNNTANVSSPVSVVGGLTNWCGVSAGGKHTLGLNTSGVLWAWGYGSYGRLGDNSTAGKSSPVSVVGGFTDWCQISAGKYHSAAVRTNGTLWTWGYGHQGQIGDNAGVVIRSSPVSVVGGFTDWCQATAGSQDSFGLRSNGTIWSWGCNGSGRLGDGTTTNRSSPVSVVGGFTDWFKIACSINQDQTLAIRAT